MRSNAELNLLALAAAQATSKLYLGDNAVAAVNSAASKNKHLSGYLDDPQLAGIFSKLVKGVKKVVNKVAKKVRESPIVAQAAQFVPFAGPIISQAMTAYQDGKAVEEQQQAMADGTLAPPPISLYGPNFPQYATALASQTQMAQGAPMSDLEKQLLYAKIQSLSTQAAQQLPPQTQFVPMPSIPVPIQQQMAQEKSGNANMQTMMIAGGVVLLAVVLMNR
jgi:hypothetical protein